MSAQSQILHANAVVVQGRGLLIKGASGKGKSGLSLQLMALGAQLVADDRTVLELQGGQVWMSAPEPIRGLIEARGIGILSAQPALRARLSAVLDLDHDETDRLPPKREISLLGCRFPLFFRVSTPYFQASLIQYLKGGRRE